jgi:hypothetical protein
MSLSSDLHQLIPYAEVKAAWNKREAGDFSLRTPWMDVTGTVPVEHLSAIDATMAALNTFDGSPRHRVLVDYFLKQFIEYPLFQIVPRSLQQFRKRTSNVSFKCDTLKLSWGGLSPCGPTWHVEHVLEASRLPDEPELFDPLSVVTFLRRMRLLSASSNDRMKEGIALMWACKEENNDLFFARAASLLEHSFYVTSHAVAQLNQGLGLNPDLDPLLSAFIASETGHERLVQKSLKALGDKRPMDGVTLCDEVKALMELLGTAARTSGLALSALIEGFEGIKYDRETRGAWDLLDHLSGMPHASRGVREHQRINDQHDHANICLEMALQLPPVSKEEVQCVFDMTFGSECLRRGLFEKLYSSMGLK